MNLGYAVIANAMILVFELDELEECKILDRIFRSRRRFYRR